METAQTFANATFRAQRLDFLNSPDNRNHLSRRERRPSVAGRGSMSNWCLREIGWKCGRRSLRGVNLESSGASARLETAP
jgi:hypothetical protein